MNDITSRMQQLLRRRSSSSKELGGGGGSGGGGGGSGSGGLVLLEGEAGIGKSRVLEELLARGLPGASGRGYMIFSRAHAATKSQVWAVRLGCCECRYGLTYCSDPRSR